ncbi:MAG: phBC6A51 family helix-turn-helix protein [Patescibacteria group bacterium]
MKITEKHRKLAQFLWENELTLEQIAKELNISVETIFYWRKQKEFDELFKEFEEQAIKETKRYLTKQAKKSAESLIDLLKKNKKGKFSYGGGIARQTCLDILSLALGQKLEDKKEDDRSLGEILKELDTSRIEVALRIIRSGIDEKK